MIGHRWVVLLLSLMLTSCSVALQQERAVQEPVAELMELSGLNRQLDQVPRIMQVALDRARVKDPEMQDLRQGRFEEIVQAMAFAYDPRQLKPAVHSRIRSALTGDDMQSVLAWLRSALGKRITNLEEEASTPEFFASRQAALTRTAGDANRILLLRKLDSAVQGTQSAINAALATQIAMVAALTSELPEKERPSVDEILDLMRKMEPDWRQTAEREMLQFFLDTYRPLSDRELDQYIAFASSDPGKRYHAAVLDGVMDAMLEAARRLENQLGKRAGVNRSDT